MFCGYECQFYFKRHIAKRLLVSCIGRSAEPPETRYPDPETGNERLIILGDIKVAPVEVIDLTHALADCFTFELSESGINIGQVKIATTME